MIAVDQNRSDEERDEERGEESGEELDLNSNGEEVEDSEDFAEPAEDEELELDEDEAVEDGIEDGIEEIDAVVELSSKEQSARSLEIRRAIEERMEKRQLDEDLDYLDMDFDE